MGCCASVDLKADREGEEYKGYDGKAQAKGSSQKVIAQKAPYAKELEAKKTYYYCDCGRSKNQPFCDGSHTGTPFTPLAFTVQESKTYYICGCKQTSHAPYCDGTHKKIDW
ncbi:unnamed protein product [Blepharisma stoltei]|uniref:Iron-binding zinc finger CDGSH type domain-containing protein n=1 Tax=Blepharisma stoltei TaxID=1481888 RepID=A0AAU9IYI5_9CILI|nr:unnamed protein product [Blepharisma stoltei]